MTRILKISINFILSIFLLITMFPVTVESAQNNPFESDNPYLLNQTNYWHDRFSSAWYPGGYGTFFPQQQYLYDYISYFGYEFPEIPLITPWSWTTLSGFSQPEFPNNINEVRRFINRSSYEQSIYSGVPFGCHPIFEQTTCVFRGACHIPMYCPSFISNSLWLTGSWE